MAAAEELLTDRTGPSVRSLPVADDIDRNDFLTRGDSGMEGRVVGDPEVAAEPVNDAFGHGRHDQGLTVTGHETVFSGAFPFSHGRT